MWNYMKNKDVFVSSNREGVKRVLEGNYAYLMESTSLEYEVQQNCNLTQIGGVLGSKGYGIALQKHSEWTDRISRQLLLYQKRGIIEMKKQKWWRSTGTPCSGSFAFVQSNFPKDKIQASSMNLVKKSALPSKLKVFMNIQHVKNVLKKLKLVKTKLYLKSKKKYAVQNINNKNRKPCKNEHQRINETIEDTLI
uniref:Ionotropic glutamate receptor C-terminal domain-containing protein n=1 Tax=Panagrolaimus sp. JU765 TaxID=591449 RepID=A0AC34PV83_9BILA